MADRARTDGEADGHLDDAGSREQRGALARRDARHLRSRRQSGRPRLAARQRGPMGPFACHRRRNSPHGRHRRRLVALMVARRHEDRLRRRARPAGRRSARLFGRQDPLHARGSRCKRPRRCLVERRTSDHAGAEPGLGGGADVAGRLARARPAGRRRQPYPRTGSERRGHRPGARHLQRTGSEVLESCVRGLDARPFTGRASRGLRQRPRRLGPPLRRVGRRR